MKTVKEKRRGAFSPSKLVLVFNGAFTLISIIRSVRTAAEQYKLSAQSISAACLGTRISAGTNYYRYIHPDIDIELEDIGTLDLKEYDMMCRVEKKYYSVRHMARKRRSSNKSKNNTRNEE